jgi:hypothetical protein
MSNVNKTNSTASSNDKKRIVLFLLDSKNNESTMSLLRAITLLQRVRQAVVLFAIVPDAATAAFPVVALCSYGIYGIG